VRAVPSQRAPVHGPEATNARRLHRTIAFGFVAGAAVVWAMAWAVSETSPTSPREPRATSAELAGDRAPVAAKEDALVPPPPFEAAAPEQPSAVNAGVARPQAANQTPLPATADAVADRPSPTASRTPVKVTTCVGALSVDSIPSGARVFVNSQPAGVTPLRLTDLPVGSRVIRLEADGYAPWSSAVRVVAHEEIRVGPTLVPLR
jgi:hypothetical protein